MATEWITGAVSNVVAGAISGAVATAGSLAGNTLSGVGNTINGVGQSIESNIRNYGDGAKDYGNYIKDWTKAPGARVATARNPLGLTDSPAINYNRPKTTPKKAIEAPKPSGTATRSAAPPAKRNPAPPANQSPAPHLGTGKVGTAKAVATKSTGATKGDKPGTAAGAAQKPSNLSTPKTMPKAATGKPGGGSKAASSAGAKAVQSRMSAKNPLGL